MHTLRFLLSLLVLIGVFSAVSAQEAEPPLLVLRDGGIDGQTVAFLENGALKLWRDGEITALDVEAEALAWAAPRYQPVYDSTYLLG